METWDSRTLRAVTSLGAAVAVTATVGLPAWGYFRPAADFARYAVAADHPEASRAGAEVLRAGGNAVDAAIAAALALGVASPASSGFGGGGFATICTARGECSFVDFRETAPAALTAEALQRTPGSSRVGGLAVATPGEPAGLAYLARTHGRLALARTVTPAVSLARGGFAVTPYLAERVRDVQRDLAMDPWLAAMWLPSGTPLAEGVRVRRPRLAATLARFGREGDTFVRGAYASAVVAAAGSRGGVITVADIAGYRPVERVPLRRAFRGYTVVTAPYPSAGGLLLAETLAALEGAPAPSLVAGSSAYLHLLAESWRGAFDDRARYVGDPENPGVIPAERLLDDARMQRRRARFDPRRAGLAIVDDAPRDGGTSHVCAMDAEGTVVSLTTTVNDLFGARVAAPTLDVVLNNQIDDFSVGAGSSYGLAAARPNALTPGRRPVSSMTPTVVLDANNRPVGCVGGAGGPRIATASTQVLLDVLLHGMDPEAAVSSPRAHHQGAPAELRVEREIAADVRDALVARGHTVVEAETLAVVQCLWVREVDGQRRILAASDPRKRGLPAGQ